MPRARNDPPPQVYARQLLPLGMGYPLWTPELGAQYLRYRQDGLRIGDVGVVVPGNGSFDVFFNICLPREHPFHQVKGVPNGFAPVHLDELDIGFQPHAETPGRVVMTSSVTQTGQRSNYEFSLSPSEGALLILPHGAESYALTQRQLFEDVAEQNGREWYNFARQRLGRIISDDSIYLITGFYKSRSWSVAAFHEITGTATEFPAHFKAGQDSGGNTTATYTWESMRSLHWRVGPMDDSGIPDQSVFISGFKIALRENILGKKWVEVVVDAPPAGPRPTKSFGGSQGRSGAAKFWKRLVPRGGKGRGATDQDEGPVATRSSGPNDASDSRLVTVTHVPETPQSVHPSDIVNRYLLRKDLNAIISVTHDSQWTVLLKKGLLKPEDLEDEHRLEKVISENYRLLSRNGVVSMKSISDLSVRVVDLSDAARQAWKADKLIDAEELLSKQIVQTTGSIHSIFTSRALIRARLQHWDAALRDAETSIGIQSSATAYIAKGFALFGLAKYGSALQALNLAIRDCDVHEKDFAVLVKSVVLFQAKYHAESLACIADLLEHCQTDIKSTCSSVQAQMFLWLATSAMKSEDCERALQFLEKARSLAPFDETMDLDTISLISGWKFDNLQFTVYQQHCEGLYFAGQIKEAAIALETMTQDLGENVKARKGNAEWFNKFHHQCLRSLESLGDAALWSQDYPEAIAQYSAVLKMDPNTRDGILVRRSKAYVGTRAWDDALNDANEAIILNPLSPRGYERKCDALRGLERYDEAIGAFNNMISNLEQIAEPHSKQLRHRNDNPSTTTLDLQSSRPLPGLDPNSPVESVLMAIQDADISRATYILNALRAERDKMNAVLAGRQTEAFEGTDNNGEFPTVTMLPNEQVRRKMSVEERDQKLREELTSLVGQNPEQDKQVPELMKMVLRLADQAVVKLHGGGELSVQDLLDELQTHNTKQREILEVLSDYWGDNGGGEQENDSDKEPRNIRTLRDEIRTILADEVKKTMADIMKLGEERRRMQQELGQLMTLKSKYGPGGEFNPEWIPQGRMPPPKAPPPDTPKHPTNRSRKGTKPPARGDSNKSSVTTPGWRTIPCARPEPPPPVVLPERNFFGLFGPLTPRETPTASPDAGLAWDSRAASPQLAQPRADEKEVSSFPAYSLLLQAEHDASMLLSPPQSSSAKEAQLVSSPQSYSPIRSHTPLSELSEDSKVYPNPQARLTTDTQYTPQGPFYLTRRG